MLTFPSSPAGCVSRPRYAQSPAPSISQHPTDTFCTVLTACCLLITTSHLQKLLVRVLLADNGQVAANAVLLPSVGEVPANLCLWARCHFRHLAGKQGVAGLLLSMATLQTLCELCCVSFSVCCGLTLLLRLSVTNVRSLLSPRNPLQRDQTPHAGKIAHVSTHSVNPSASLADMLGAHLNTMVLFAGLPSGLIVASCT